MTPEKWQQVKELFESALECAPAERPAFLDRACEGDEPLRREVESLIASYEEGESFMERPAVAMAAETLAGSQGESLIGQTISHYQIVREIGSGGMGEVYLAQDTRLGRPVALKLLLTLFTTDDDRLRRFEQEAHAASTLSHPNVCMIHEVGETEDDRHYIAMEYVEGVTLRQHLTETRLKLSEVLDVAVQIAAALTAAHAAGIVHRDIKPENIMERSDGYIKVLDFGLAKLTEQEVNKLTAAPGAQVKTDTGLVMGTSRYMSPEQARGLAVDARTDIWSLGVVLYEMVTGCPPFEGGTTSDVIVSILEREPLPLAQFLPEAPTELERIISKTLHKDREGRYQTAKDLLIELKSLKQDLELEAKLEHSLQPGSSGRGKLRTSARTSAARPQPRWWANRLIWLSAVVILVVGVAVRFYLSRLSPESSTRSSSKSSVPPMKVVPFTTFPGHEFDPAFSPDGKQVAFAWDGGSGDKFDIYVKLIDAGAPLRLTTHPGVDDFCPTWSPDGRYIAFIRLFNPTQTRPTGESGIYIVPALGGPERKLRSWSDQPPVPGLDWSPNGKFLAFVDKGSAHEPFSIFLLSIENLETRKLTSPSSQYLGDVAPAFSPDSQSLAFVRKGAELAINELYIVPVTGGEATRLTFDNQMTDGPAWTADGREIVFALHRKSRPGLWRISASGGTPERLDLGGDDTHAPTISRQDGRLAYVQESFDWNIWRVEVSGSTGQSNAPTKLISSTRLDYGPQISPDGKRIVFQSNRSGSFEIWVCDSDGLNPHQLTSSGNYTGTPRWSPDGRQIAFDSRPQDNADIYVINADGGLPRRITTETSQDAVPSWSRDGQWIYFGSKRSEDWQVWKKPVAGGEAIQVTKQGGFAAFESPDGKFVYYAKFDAHGLWKVPVEGGEETLVLDLLKGEGYWGHWAVVDQGIYFVNPEAKPHPAIEFFSFATQRVTRIAVPEKDLIPGPPNLAVSPDGRWILYTQVDQSGSDIMLVENFQ